MIDNFALGLSHGLMLIAAWLLVRRDDLDHESAPGEREGGGERDPRKSRWGGGDA